MMLGMRARSWRRWVVLSPLSTFVLALACGGAPAEPVTQAARPEPAPAATAKRSILTAHDVDAMLDAARRARGITKSAAADDATFLRRVTLDVTGTIPHADRAAAFLKDTSPDKRARYVAELLASPEYASHWAAYLDDLLMGQARAGDLDRQTFRAWLKHEVATSTPWDRLALSLLTATGENTAGGPRRSLAEAEATISDGGAVSPPVNWILKFSGAPQDLAGSASKIFLGTQIQCAQCHDHKTEKWTQDDFRSFAACFARVQQKVVGNRNMKGPRVVDVADGPSPAPKILKDPDLAPLANATPRALDKSAVTGVPRQSIAQWMVKSPWFAQAFVNRMWGHFLGRGFVNPVDDLRPSNPAEAPELFARLAEDFAASGYDIKRLITLITSTEAYALSAARPDGAAADAEIALWSRFRMTPLGPEELVNALLAATDTGTMLARRSGDDVEDLKIKLTRAFSFVFDVDEEFDQARYEGTLAQALTLLNGRFTTGGASARPGTTVHSLATGKLAPSERIHALYMRTLSRPPTTEETAAMTAYLASAPPPGRPPSAPPPAPANGRGKGKPGSKPIPGATALRRLPPPTTSGDRETAALEDIQWALLNSSEFVLNH